MANEKRLIDADKLVETIVNTPSEVAKIHTYNVLTSLAERQNEILDIVENSPTIEAAPVVHGRWEMISDYYARCPNCRTMFEVRPAPMVFKANNRYCRNCGAKMDGGVSDG